MALPKKYNTIIINVLLAVVASLVINFSYLLAIRQQEYTAQISELDETLHKGTLRISPDGYGYITGCSHTVGRDSIYVSSRNISRLELKDGSVLAVQSRRSHLRGGNEVLAFIKEVDGKPFDYRAVYDRENDSTLFGLQFGYYFAAAFVLLLIMTMGALRDTSWKFFVRRSSIALVVAVGLFFMIPVARFRSEEIVLNFMNTRDGVIILDPVAMLKCSFVPLLALLYGRIYQLMHQREGILLENERLRSDNLAARYNTLINQINPHFLFNSLNSLSALVREGRDDDAVSYIDRLSDTFRYTIRNEPHTTTTLAEELEFAGAYKYLLEARYDEKLFVDFDIEQDKTGWMLPSFSIQPLIENAVKHNSITRARPLRISICTEGDNLVVSNPINPKIEPEKGTGIGLANLASRWQLMTGRSIEILNDGKTFTVRLPFIKGTDITRCGLP